MRSELLPDSKICDSGLQRLLLTVGADTVAGIHEIHAAVRQVLESTEHRAQLLNRFLAVSAQEQPVPENKRHVPGLHAT